jgi:hypothetical protein
MHSSQGPEPTRAVLTVAEARELRATRAEAERR